MVSLSPDPLPLTPLPGTLLWPLRRETVSNVVNGKTHKRVREHDLRELQTPEQRAAKYDRALSKALELRGRRRR